MNTPQDFCLWLQGFVEIADSDTISEKQWLIIKDHLKLVLDKVTPDRKVDFKVPINPAPKLTDLIGKDLNWPNNQWPITTITC